MAVLQKLWQKWKAFGHFMGNVVGRVVLSIFYFTVFAPFGLGVRLMSDPLGRNARPGSLWKERPAAEQTLADAGRQY